MLLDYYNLKEQPFGVTPDPRFLYLGATHREALASLAYGIQSGRGFMSLIATPGMGKTTILFHLLQHLDGRAKVAFLCQTLGRPEDIMRAVTRDLGIGDDSASASELERRLNEALLAEARQGGKVIIVIDEAQNLADEALETVRLLSNFETSSDKLMQIVLSGQTQLDARLSSPQLVQLRQRMSAFARLEPLTFAETREYLHHRMKVAGYSSSLPLFAAEAEKLIAKCSRGIPRHINNICFNALSLGWVEKQRTIGKDVIREVVNDLGLQTRHSFTRKPALIRNHISSLKPSRKAALMTAFPKRSLASMLILIPLLGVFGLKTIRPKPSPKETSVNGRNAVQMDGAGASHPRGQAADDAISTSASQSQADVPSAPTSSRQHIRHSTQVGAATVDPDVLWKRVRRENKEAEVELARMYLTGTVVPRNCDQAQVLLQAAAKKGSTSAAELLNGEAAKCR